MPGINEQSDSNKSKVEASALRFPSAPTITLPKGGGAIRGIGEKFAANPVSGTGSMVVPIPVSPGRAGFTPHLELNYDSGSGNGPYGFGFHFHLPSITLRTDKGIPQYRAAEESDIFMLSEAEDLVPLFKRKSDGTLARDKDGKPLYDEEMRDGHVVRRYRPRMEGLFAIIEKWTRLGDHDTHWRSISKDNILTVYGRSSESRITDPTDSGRVFSWLITESYDDKGNAIVYEYVAENDDNVDVSLSNERNRQRSANRYLKYIRYGNRQPLLLDPSVPSFRRPHIPVPDLSSVDWMFEVVFDFGEGHYQELAPDAEARIFASSVLRPPSTAKWPARLDPFSTYRSGFEIRTYRLCRRVLLFHHFPDELGMDDYLVRSTEFVYNEKPNGSFLSKVVQSGFKRITSAARYLKKALPPLEFEYSISPLDDLSFDKLLLQELDTEALENLPAGIDGTQYRWLDLDGEGISGVLSEQAGSWFYKRNLGEGRFAPLERVSPHASLAALNRGRQQLIDVAGDGNLDLVELDSSRSGFYPRCDNGWEPFRTFRSLPELNWQDPNLRFVDLTGDGHADVLISEDEAFAVWHESFAEEGFGPARRVAAGIDEEAGPRLVFSDGTQSIYLADMSGDGLSDLVRIRSGEVCYWPNVGYGRFGAKVSLDNVPWFDDADAFDQHRIHLFDTDGSGPTDIVYFGRQGVYVYLNQSGNSLSDARILTRVPPADSHTSISVVDLLGRGTACLVWSSPLPRDARCPMRYIDLMGGVKPHLIIKSRNNLGAETTVEYASSTHFYLKDKSEGTPWTTRLPFPVHVVTKVETHDLISGNRFFVTYSYHNGYFDPIEREFRGFGRVDQTDSQEFGVLTSSSGSTSTKLKPEFAIPPTLTKTWFHTGAYRPGERISRHFEDEYYREGDPSDIGTELSLAQLEAILLPDTVLPQTLADSERREAIRSLKGAILRQEVYALDGSEAAGRPYSVSERNYTIEPVQTQETNRHSIFFTHERETINFQYDRKLFPVVARKVVSVGDPAATLLADPRVTHSVTLAVDDFGNVLQSMAIAYGRRFDDSDPVLNQADRAKQRQTLITFTEATFTNAPVEKDAYRAPLPAEVTTYEIVNLQQTTLAPSTTNLFRFDELVSAVDATKDGTRDLPYEDFNATGATGLGPYRRPIERTRTRYRSNNLAQLLPMKSLQTLAVAGEAYKLAFTPGILSTAYQRRTPGGGVEDLMPTPANVFPADPSRWGDRGGYVDIEGNGNWWIPSDRVFFHSDSNVSATKELAEATQHFFLPRRFRDPFGQSSVVDYSSDLLTARVQDAFGNTIEAEFDYRVLKAKQVTDPNGNRSFAKFDAFGLPVASAVRGKPSENLGDSIDDFTDLDADPSLVQLQDFVRDPKAKAGALLKSATSRVVYDLDRFQRCGEPPFAATLARETHVADLQPGENTRIQVSFAYSDGFDRELQSKIPAEVGDAASRGAIVALPTGDLKPGPLTLDGNGLPIQAHADSQWVGKGRTVYNNKGKPVKQYEPFFSSTHLYEPEPEMTDTGVTPILFYDPMDRVVATLHPNHTYEKVVFDPWREEIWDVNDTVRQSEPKDDPDVGKFFERLPVADYKPSWYDARSSGQKGVAEKAAAEKAVAHAATPSLTYFDTLGRAVITIADNGRDSNGIAQKFATRLSFDIEGNQRSVADAKNRVVMLYEYDMAGNRISQASMEAGQRWLLNDAVGKPIRSWDSRAHNFRIEYDELRRASRSFVVGADPKNPNLETCVEVSVYGETAASSLTQAQVLQKNLRGRIYQQYDTAGLVLTDAYDFKGNPLSASRRLLQNYKTPPDWANNPALEAEAFISSTVYDALNRPVQLVAPHSDRPRTKFNVVQPGFNEANLLERLDVFLGQLTAPSALLDAAKADLPAVRNLDYNARGQRTRIDYGNDTATEYFYDDQTFRLIHLKTTRTNNTGLLGRLLGRGSAQPVSVCQDLFYSYDPVGNITHIRDDAQQTIYFRNSVVKPDCDYVYDPIYRLTRASGREHIGQLSQPQTTWDDEFRINLPHPGDGAAMRTYTEQYFYDAVGNFEQLVHQATNGNWTRTYSYDETSLLESGKKSNRLSNTAVGSTKEPYSHDAHGNMGSIPHLTSVEWDFRDQLSSTSRQFVNSNSPPASTPQTTYYVYDYRGERVRKVTESQAGVRREERIYLGGTELYRKFAADGVVVTLERETLHVMDDKQRVALVESRTNGNDGSPAQLVRYQFGNHLGSASVELDNEGRIVSYEEYYPYGSTSYEAINSMIKGVAKRYRFSSKEQDDETGFYYSGARHYAAWLGRWISCDPVSLTDGMNLFQYVNCNPINLNDPTGTYGSDDLVQDSGRLTRAIGVLLPPVAAANALASTISTKVSEAVTGKSAPSGGEPAKTLSGTERVEAATDALITLTPAAPLQPLHHTSKVIGQSIGNAIKGKISKTEAGVEIVKSEPTGIVNKTFETAEALDRAEVASNKGDQKEAIRGYVDAGLSFLELVEAGTMLVAGGRAAKTGAPESVAKAESGSGSGMRVKTGIRAGASEGSGIGTSGAPSSPTTEVAKTAPPRNFVPVQEIIPIDRVARGGQAFAPKVNNAPGAYRGVTKKMRAEAQRVGETYQGPGRYDVGHRNPLSHTPPGARARFRSEGYVKNRGDADAIAKSNEWRQKAGLYTR